jgi:hypothetical protein
MDKRRKKSTSRVSGDISNARQKLADMPVFNAAGEGVIKKTAKLLARKAAQSMLQDIASGKRSVEDVLLGVTRTVTGTIDSGLRDEKRVADSETIMNEQYRKSLIKRRRETKPRRMRRGKKNEFLVSGQVLHPETNKPVAGMVVEAIDKDIFKHDLLGVDTTDSQGRFEIAFKKKDFKERGEGLPEVLLRVGSDRKKTLFSMENIVRPKAGERKTINITLPEDQAAAVEKITVGRDYIDEKRLKNVSQTLILDQVQHMVVQEMGRAFKEGMDKAAGLLEARIERAGKAKASNTSR